MAADTGTHDETHMREGDFTIKETYYISEEYSRADQSGQFNPNQDADSGGIQVPFSKAIKGPPSIRNRSMPYIVTKG
tara:strand:- start:624 stop:854 length:231 start_codon:yes stop_codon:yes gene_type:complete